FAIEHVSNLLAHALPVGVALQGNFQSRNQSWSAAHGGCLAQVHRNYVPAQSCRRTAGPEDADWGYDLRLPANQDVKLFPLGGRKCGVKFFADICRRSR